MTQTPHAHRPMVMHWHCSKISKREKWCGREAVIALFLRQLKFPLSNNNRLSNHWAVSTGTFVIHSVIHQCDSCWLKSHPSTHRNLTTSKKGAKGSVVVCPAQNINGALSLKLDKPLAGLGLGETPSVYEAGRYLAFCFRFLSGWSRRLLS